MYIVSMATLPSRKKRIYDNLNSILNQSFKFDKLCINIDDYMSFEEYDFYFGLKELDERIEINICDKKWRSCNKLLPTIKKYPDDVIITVDDDIIYPVNCIKVLIEEYETHKNSIIALEASPVSIDENGYYNGYLYTEDVCIKHSGNCKYLSNCCLFPPKTFDGTDVFDYEKMMYCTDGCHDELWFWLNSIMNGVKCTPKNNYLRMGYPWLYDIPEHSNTDSLYQTTNSNPEILKNYITKINRMYGEKLKEVLAEKNEFFLTPDSLYSFFYIWPWLKSIYEGKYMLNIEDLSPGMIQELRDFLNGSGVNLDDVV